MFPVHSNVRSALISSTKTAWNLFWAKTLNNVRHPGARGTSPMASNRNRIRPWCMNRSRSRADTMHNHCTWHQVVFHSNSSWCFSPAPPLERLEWSREKRNGIESNQKLIENETYPRLPWFSNSGSMSSHRSRKHSNIWHAAMWTCSRSQSRPRWPNPLLRAMPKQHFVAASHVKLNTEGKTNEKFITSR